MKKLSSFNVICKVIREITWNRETKASLICNSNSGVQIKNFTCLNSFMHMDFQESINMQLKYIHKLE